MKTIIAAVIGVLLSVAGMACAEPTESQVKAAMIFNFFKYVDWPAQAFSSPESTLVVCVIGQDPMGDIIEAIIKGKTIQGRRLMLRRISKGEADQCHAMYIGQTGSSPKVARDGLLTIGDSQGFASSGGIIGFVNAETRIAFEINLEAAQKAGLKISSQLLKLAKIAKTGG